MKKQDLIDFMRKRGGRVTTKAAREAGFSNSLLALLESEGVVERESRGVWALSDVPLDDFAVIALRWPRAVFSEGSALYLQGLSDRAPADMDVTLPQGYNAVAIEKEFPGIRIRRCVPERFSLGLEEGVSPTGAPVNVYDKERCLCDQLKLRRTGKADSQTFVTALNTYMAWKGRNLPKLARYAEKLGLSEELARYTEVMT